MKLENAASLSDWKYGDSVWSIPKDREEGYLSVVGTNKVLGVIKGNIVTLQTKEIIDNANQMWIRQIITLETHGFILINKQSGLYLTGKQGTTNPTVEG